MHQALILASTKTAPRNASVWARDVMLLDTASGFEVVTERWYIDRDGDKDCDVSVSRFASLADARAAYDREAA
jgi:hypothetical protein